MNLITPVDIHSFPEKITRGSNILMLGSCFTTNIGQMLQSYGFNVLINPFGVLYNPASIAACLERIAVAALERTINSETGRNGSTGWPYFTNNDVIDISLNSTTDKGCIIQDSYPFPSATTDIPTKKATNYTTSQTASLPPLEDGNLEEATHRNPRRYCSFHHHSSFAKDTPEEFLESANRSLAQAAEFFKKADTIVITLGTSYVFRHIERDMIVANCRKINPKEFSRELLSIDEATESLRRICSTINNPTAISVSKAPLADTCNLNLQKGAANKTTTCNSRNIIFTVSPIRHMADGAHGNLISKSTLLHAINRVTFHSNVCSKTDTTSGATHKTTSILPAQKTNNVSYFPSYEIMMDELRDYRFYAEDMVHPSETAVKYIFERFKESAIAVEDYQWMQQEHKKWLQTQHRSLSK